MSLDLLRNQDAFGQPVPINYNGEGTYKTVFGGIVTLAVITFTVLYLLLKIDQTNSTELWHLNRQVIPMTMEEIN